MSTITISVPPYYDDRLTTLDHVRQAGINICSGGIIGMGESRDDRINSSQNWSCQNPESVPINMLVPLKARQSRSAARAVRALSGFCTIAVTRPRPNQLCAAVAGREGLN